jgi:hypothetical protein
MISARWLALDVTCGFELPLPTLPGTVNLLDGNEYLSWPDKPVQSVIRKNHCPNV